MALKIWNENDKPARDVFLRLIDCGVDTELCVVNENGKRVHRGTILHINNKTLEVHRTAGLGDFGFARGERSRVLID